MTGQVPHIAWRKSSYSGRNGNCVEVAVLPWHRSSHSGRNGDCVEAARIPGVVAARDSKRPDGPRITVAPAAWAAFLGVLRDRRG